jgi:hypothetical protein
MSNKQIVIRKNPKKPKKQQQLQRRKKNIPKSNMPRKAMVPRKFISDCARDYLQALTDPFGYTSNGLPCVPDLNDLASYKVSTIATGTFVVGTTGIGYVAVAPQNATNDVPIGVTTTALFAGAAIASAGVGITSFVNPRAPYGTANLRDSRLVAMGLRCRYMGTELNRGGRIITAVTAAQGDGWNGTTTNGILSRPDSSSFECDRKWHGVNWKPLSINDVTYISNRNNDATTAGSPGYNQMVCYVDGGTTGNSYEFQLVAYWEFIPRYDSATSTTFSVPNVSKSHADLVGLSNVRDYLGQHKSSEQGPSVFQRGLTFIKNLALGAVSSYSPVLGGFARAILN